MNGRMVRGNSRGYLVQIRPGHYVGGLFKSDARRFVSVEAARRFMRGDVRARAGYTVVPVTVGHKS